VLLHIPDQLLFDTNTQLAYNLLTRLCHCGIAYAFGKGVLKDDKKAVYWYQKAADQGYAEAQSILGPLPIVYAIPRLDCAFAYP
jgi:hypothetical protein